MSGTVVHSPLVGGLCVGSLSLGRGVGRDVEVLLPKMRHDSRKTVK